MSYLAFGILLFTFTQGMVALFNLICKERLRVRKTTCTKKISILIPARNEASTIGDLLTDLQQQLYQNIEVIVYDDQSTDHTHSIVLDFIQTDSRFTLLEGGALPPGWSGKSHACYQAASRARGELLLFLDADVRLGREALLVAPELLIQHKLTLLSIFPTQVMHSGGEWCTVPLMNYILLTLLPLPLVRYSTFPSLAAANGQFMLFDALQYQQLQPHLALKNQMVEDISIARWLKKKRLRVGCLLAEGQVSCRMYRGWVEGVEGLARSLLHFFGQSPLLALLFWSLTTWGFIPFLLTQSWSLLLLLLLFILFSLLNHILVAINSRQSALLNLLYLIPQQLTMGAIVFTSIYRKLTHSYQWKERIVCH